MANAPKIQYRDVAPVLRWFRDLLLGRKHTINVRFQPEMASRSPPPPVIPDGPAHRLHDNYYCNRDGRREVAPPALLIVSGLAKLPAGGEKEAAGAAGALRRPGSVYHWD